jgi:hypothetical protein
MATAKKISELTALTTASTDDLLVIVDSPASDAVTKKITISSFYGNVQATALFQNTVTVNNSLTIKGTVKVGTSNVMIVAGVATTRTDLRTEIGDGSTVANGSIFLSTAGKMYLKVNNANAATDWQKVTTTAAD